VGNASALGAATSGTSVAEGAVLDLNAFSLGAEPVTVQGAGSGNGGLINSSASTQSNALRFLSLSGDTTFGGTGRWDIRANPTATFSGNNFALTKTNANEVWLVNVGGTALGDININQGVLGIQGSTTLGDSTKNVTVASNAALAVWFTDNNALNKKLVMNNAGLHSYPGDNIFSGPITLNGSNLITASNIFTIQGSIGGSGSFTKLGSGILALTASNSFTGTTLVSAGTLQVRNSWALGTTNGGTTIASGARLDINAVNLGAEPITVGGTGLGNGGAIINNGGTQNNALRFVTLTSSTTFGGIGRWDIRANPTAAFTGNNFNLTKVGRNEVWIVDAGPTGLGNITVSEGTLGIQGSTTLGNAANSVIVSSGASLGFWGNGTNILSKVLSMSSARVFNGNGSNTFNGTAALSGANFFDITSSTTLVMGGAIGGAGSLILTNPGTLMLVGNNTYSGGTLIVSGMLQVGNGGSTGSLGPANVTNKTLLAFWRSNSFTVANQISGIGGIKHGVIDALNPYIGSVLTLSGNNTYSGPTSLYGNGNMIAVGSDTALGTGTVSLYGNNNGNSVSGILSANSATRTLANNFIFGAGGIIQFGSVGSGALILNGASVTTDGADKTIIVSNATTTINSPIGINSKITKIGPGTLVLGGNNSIGGMVINEGTLRIDSEARLGVDPGGFNPAQLSVNGGVLQTTASFAIDDPNRGVTLGAGGGVFDVASGTILSISNTITGPGKLAKSGPGTLVLAGNETFTGATSNSAGSLVIDGISGGSGLTVAAGSLMGRGIITAPVTVLPGATLSPGTSIGVLSVSNTLTLLGTTLIELDKLAGTNDLVQGMSSVNYGGTLNLTNFSGTLAAGDSFKIFDALDYSGSFTNVVPSTPGQWLAWDLGSLNINGTVKVISALPQFNPPVISAGQVLLSGSGGNPGGTYYVLSSTNVALPSSQWTVVATNQFDAAGNFSFSLPIDPLLASQFYRIQTQ
jgi:autotransporter-associated beta strand protein